MTKRRGHRTASAEGKLSNAPAWTLSAIGLFICRYFVPTESAAQGETLWISQLWLLGTAVGLWLAWRNGRRTLQWDMLDLCIAGVAAAQIVSACGVLLAVGDKRAALNMIWEWLAVAVAVLVMRRLLQNLGSRRLVIGSLTISAVCLAGLGVWQHFVDYPALQAKVIELRELEAGGAETAIQRQRLQQLRRDLGPEAALLEGDARSAWEARIRHSTEPFGRFALANSLAAILLVGLLLAAATLWSRRDSESSLVNRLPGRFATALVAFCLLLSKSRTAWLAAIVGVIVLLFLERRATAPRPESSGRDHPPRSTGRVAAIGGAAAVVVLLLGIFSVGGLDRQVFSEAPKSVQYRWEYWTATARMVREHPWLGVGPGNFRQHYLHYKLPGASEEITDPHNLVLEALATGGVLGLAALLFAAFALGTSWRQRSSPRKVTPRTPGGRQLAIVGGVGIGLVLAKVFVLDGQWDWELVALSAGWIAVAAVFTAYPDDQRWLRAGVLAAFAGLSVHLLGSGGFSMPAIIQTLLLLGIFLAAAPVDSPDHKRPIAVSGRMQTLVASLVLAGFAVACGVTSTGPVLLHSSSLRVGEYLLAIEGDLPGAERAFRDAVDADDLNPDGWQALGSVYAFRSLRSGHRSELEQAGEYQQEAIRRDPHAAGRYAVLAGWYREFDRRSPSAETAQRAADLYSEAVARYPNSASLNAEWALILSRIESNRAQEIAKYALHLNGLNAMAGHTDKLLADETVRELEGIAGSDP